MRAGAVGALLLLALTAGASAEVRYDRKLEAATLERVASSFSMVGIRPAFGLGDKIQYVRQPADAVVTASVPEASDRRELSEPASKPEKKSRTSIQAF